METKDKQNITRIAEANKPRVEVQQITPCAGRRRRSTFAILFYINRTKIRKCKTSS